MNKVQEYYTNTYDENKRLGEGCDNRHKVEIINKGHLIKDIFGIVKSINDLRIGENESIRIIDVGAGTGFWTDFILKNFDNVEIYCGDLVEKHNDIMRKRFKDYPNVHVVNIDALKLNNSLYGTFDIVLCGGPLYHLNNEDSQKVCNNLLNVCNECGYILVDWLSEASGNINWSLMKGHPVKNISDDDKMFYYKDSYIMSYLFREYEILHYGIDSITRFVADKINNYTDEELELWCKNIRKYWNKNADLSEHSISVIRKC